MNFAVVCGSSRSEAYYSLQRPPKEPLPFQTFRGFLFFALSLEAVEVVLLPWKSLRLLCAYSVDPAIGTDGLPTNLSQYSEVRTLDMPFDFPVYIRYSQRGTVGTSGKPILLPPPGCLLLFTLFAPLDSIGNHEAR